MAATWCRWVPAPAVGRQEGAMPASGSGRMSVVRRPSVAASVVRPPGTAYMGRYVIWRGTWPMRRKQGAS
ncbi:hypothetical protein GCM10027610_051560 [Dactylosporangium cerinum]